MSFVDLVMLVICWLRFVLVGVVVGVYVLVSVVVSVYCQVFHSVVVGESWGS